MTNQPNNNNSGPSTSNTQPGTTPLTAGEIEANAKKLAEETAKKTPANTEADKTGKTATSK